MRQKHTFRQWIFSWVLPVTESERVIIIPYVTDSGGNNKQIINQSINYSFGRNTKSICRADMFCHGYQSVQYPFHLIYEYLSIISISISIIRLSYCIVIHSSLPTRLDLTPGEDPR